MADRWVEIADGFYNVRGSFKVFKVVDIGTQCSVVRRPSGRFLLLDAYLPTGEALDRLLALTDGGEALEAVLNLHPFHTVHVKRVAQRFPGLKWYGTERHVAKAPELPWEDVRTEDPAIGEVFEELAFTVPAGVELIPDNEDLHFSSVLAFHPATRTLHVDDTLTWVHLPLVWGLRFHPTLKQTLEKRAGAAADFRAWATELIARCEDIDHLCTAHLRPLPPTDGDSVAERVRTALQKVESVLAAHEEQYG